MRESGTSEVTFVYVGKGLPRYGPPSLSLALEHSGLGVRLIAEAAIKPLVPAGVRFTALEDFYNHDEFLDASARVLFSHSMRDGFWLKTLERFFVLGQYQRQSGVTTLFHAELDQLLFRADRLVRHIEAADLKGFLVPRHNENRALASIFYCNESSKLQSLLDFASSSEPFDNEMSVISNWIRECPDGAHYLPTIRSFFDVQCDFSGIETFGGISDAAQLGQWIGGIDPRNVPFLRRPTNKFVDRPEPMLASQSQLETLRFRVNNNGYLMMSSLQRSSEVVYNLHIHSKIHYALARRATAIPALLEAVSQRGPVVPPGASGAHFRHHVGRGMRKTRKNVLRLVDRSRRALSSVARGL